MEYFVRHSVTDVENSTDKLFATVSAQSIFIGTHQFTPTEKVHFTSKGIRIIAPNVKNSEENVILDIQIQEVVKIVSNFNAALSIVFIYVQNSCGAYVRESLEMQNTIHDNSRPFFSPIASTEYYKRIVLVLENVSEEAKSVIRSIYVLSKHDEINARDANEMLKRCSFKERSGSKGSVSGRSAPIKDSPTDNIRQILIYPPGTGGISINTEDYMCLAIDQYLNDVIIDFFLKYLLAEQLSDEQRDRTHVFSTFFYKRLTTMTTARRVGGDTAKMTASQKRHARVKNWTKSVNLFDKDFVIIPINEQSHWFLAIVCYPALKGPETMDGGIPIKQASRGAKKSAAERKRMSLQIGNTTITPVKREMESIYLPGEDDEERDEAEGDESDLASDDSETESGSQTMDPSKPVPVKQPCILIFDSLAGTSRSRVVATLRDYLTCEYKAKMGEQSTHTFTKDTIPGHSVKVPQQNNFTDCGLYLLQYVEQFFKDPVRDYRIPIKQLANWFDTMVVTRKREEISDLLIDLIKKFNINKLPLPDIKFPTLNGNLREVEETFNEDGEFEEEELEEELEEDESEEHLDPTETDTSSPEKCYPSKGGAGGGDTSSSSGGLLSRSNSSSNVVKTISTIIPPNGNPSPATTTRTIFKRTLDIKGKSESARKNARFDELRNS